ncbi:site-specific integrase [Paenibacillus larvae subsp. pulvifaciens]|uniref:Site-specific integrase n=1 Tax=Paenibacillus larvae subsp. pulvifaciens TaxID=1477 RepID=A0A1V0UPL9_9BACL|nr:site-specific integrase [Paenibacillus larvae]ARF67077.1 site-specific integrase [Paenibacillus larvae subsp. pulvifaciens]
MASIQKRGDNSYLLVVEAGKDAKGKRIKRTKTVRVDEKLLKTPRKLSNHLELELAKFQLEVEAGEYISPEKMTIGSFVDEWKDKYAVKELSPLTFKTYQHHLNNHIIPTLGLKRLDEIKPFHITSFLHDLSLPGARKDGRGEKLSSGTIEYIYRILRNLFNRAVEWQLIGKHPMEGVKKPKVTKTEMKFYDESEAQRVIESLYKESAMWRLFILTAILGGLRRGEILALEWDNINFKEGFISVNKSISLTVNGQAIIKEPKTKGSKRNVTMPEWYFQELKEYSLEWKKEKLKVGELWSGGVNEYIFHAGFGKPLYHTLPTKWWREFCKRHNIRHIRFHDLRHSHVAILLENETDLKIIQERLGHSSFQTTADTYAHISKSVNKATADKLDKLNPRKNSSTMRQQL